MNYQSIGFESGIAQINAATVDFGASDAPLKPEDGSIAPWSFVDGNKTVEAVVSGPFIAKDIPTMLGAAVEGLGLAQVPEPIAAGAVRAGKLVRVLESFAPMAPRVFLYYPSRHQIVPKLRAFIEHVKYRSADAPRDATTARTLRKLSSPSNTLG